MIVLGIDTATQRDRGRPAAGRRRPCAKRATTRPPGAHPGHATRLLGDGRRAARATPGLRWGELDRIAVGVGPGQRSPACASASPPPAGSPSRCARSSSSGVSSLRALALRSREPAPARGAPARSLAVIDARRGEVFAAAYEPATTACRELAPPRRARARAARAALRRGASSGSRGERACSPSATGRVRYREELGAAGLEVAAARRSRCTACAAGAICELGARARRRRRTPAVLPDYLRRPDAELALGARAQRRAERRDERDAPSSPAADRRRSRSGRCSYPDLPQVIGDRAARVPDAVVAGDVRARALQAVGHLPGAPSTGSAWSAT